VFAGDVDCARTTWSASACRRSTRRVSRTCARVLTLSVVAAGFAGSAATVGCQRACTRYVSYAVHALTSSTCVYACARICVTDVGVHTCRRSRCERARRRSARAVDRRRRAADGDRRAAGSCCTAVAARYGTRQRRASHLEDRADVCVRVALTERKEARRRLRPSAREWRDLSEYLRLVSLMCVCVCHMQSRMTRCVRLQTVLSAGDVRTFRAYKPRSAEVRVCLD
jgi:hypothetical protein